MNEDAPPPPHRLINEEIASYHPEFDHIDDVAAANAVMEPGIAVWQIPMPVYSMVGVGHAELRTPLHGTSPLVRARRAGGDRLTLRSFRQLTMGLIGK